MDLNLPFYVTRQPQLASQSFFSLSIRAGFALPRHKFHYGSLYATNNPDRD